jgi:hypothetical protein
MQSKFKHTLILLFFFTASIAQNKMEVKLNMGMAFSSPLYDIGDVTVKGKTLQPHLSLESKIVRVPFGTDAKLGLKLSGVAGMEWANFLANDRSTELNISNPHLKARVYPLTYNGSVFEYLENQSLGNMPAAVELLLGIAEVAAINSLHFDYGVSFAKIEEVAYLDEISFEPETVNRTTTYTGWGFQPQIFQSDNEKWTANAFFDFGKYKWKNANGGTSGMKISNLGFGIQRNF